MDGRDCGGGNSNLCIRGIFGAITMERIFCGLLAWLAIALFSVGVHAFVLHGGSNNPSAPSAVQATFQNGQTFVTWPDQATGSAGNNWRYSMYRSTSPLNSGN